MTTPQALDRELTLRAAVNRHDDLRLRDSLVDPDGIAIPAEYGSTTTGTS